MKIEREVEEDFNLHTRRESFGSKRIDLNDLLRRASKQKSEEKKQVVLTEKNEY